MNTFKKNRNDIMEAFVRLQFDVESVFEKRRDVGRTERINKIKYINDLLKRCLSTTHDIIDIAEKDFEASIKPTNVLYMYDDDHDSFQTVRIVDKWREKTPGMRIRLMEDMDDKRPFIPDIVLYFYRKNIQNIKLYKEAQKYLSKLVLCNLDKKLKTHISRIDHKSRLPIIDIPVPNDNNMTDDTVYDTLNGILQGGGVPPPPQPPLPTPQ